MRGVQVIAGYTLILVNTMDLPVCGVMLNIIWGRYPSQNEKRTPQCLGAEARNIHESLFMYTMADDSNLGVDVLVWSELQRAVSKDSTYSVLRCWTELL